MPRSKPDRTGTSKAQPKTTSPAGPIGLNAFSTRFLESYGRFDEPATASEAEFAGPWRRHQQGSSVSLLRTWEDEDRGDRPYASFTDEQTALLAAAVLPARGHLGTYRIQASRDAEGFRVERNGRAVGRVRLFDEHFAEALSLAEALLRAPASLALLLRAAGPTALQQVGRILATELTADL